jgi:hypothetical protein
MNEREQFEMGWRQFVARYLEGIQTMTETQVVNALRSWNASRKVFYGEEWAFVNSIALKPVGDSEDEINKLISDLSSYPRPSGNPFQVLDNIEDALKKRLDTLRRGGK